MREVNEFIADDGSKWDTREEAEKHDRFVAAERAYRDAEKAYLRVIFESQKTADGFPLDLSEWTYYCVIDRIYEPPRIAEIRGLGLSEIHLDLQSQGLNWKRLLVKEWREGKLIETYYDLNSIYKKRENAEKQQLALLLKQRGYLNADIEKLEQKYGGERSDG